jgi:hypothetical protein
LLEAGRADLDCQVRVVFCEKVLDVAADLVVEVPVQIAAAGQRSRYREAEGPQEKRPATVDAAGENDAGP